MALQYGIVGLPNVGKSTLFNALSNGNATAANFPFCTIEPNIGVVKVPDKRLQQLASVIVPQKVVPTYIEFVDIAGLVKGASQGEGLGNQFLANIREVNAIVHVVRCFQNEQIIHVAGHIDPGFDKAIIDHELQMKDVETIRKRIAKVEKTAKTGNKEAQAELELLERCAAHLANGGNVRNLDRVEAGERVLLQSWQLLTTKPVLYLANVDEPTLQQGTNRYVEQLREAIGGEGAEVVLVCAELESQMAELTPEEQQIFLEEYGLSNAALDTLINTSYQLLDLITYFTAGPQEVRAWTIKRGTKAPQAAGLIHSDIERGFIKAEVIKLPDYLHYKTELACREAGKIAIEGKEYLIEDGDIIHFRFNV